ncbi:MAG: NAD(P)H-hydrate dehydratase [Anaerovoracaceae bacterium]
MKITGLINLEYVNTVIKKRPKEVHKGNCGKLLIVAGSTGMAGAAVLSSKAAMKTGSGLVKVCIKKKLFPIIQMAVPEVICIKWGKTKNDLEQFDVIAIGPGMGAGKRTKKILKKILKTYTKTLVIDADGLNAVAKYNLFGQVKAAKCNVVITPHIGEAKRLLNCQMITDLTPIQLADSLVAGISGIVVVKGPESLVAIDGEHAYTNTTGNPGMATAGSGDVLTGIISSLIGQGIAFEDGVKAGVFIHGMAGDLARDTLGEYGMIASDIVSMIPTALKTITEK